MSPGRRRAMLAVLCLVAFAHAGFFIFHMQPDRDFWAGGPQSAGGYKWLAWNLLHGRYTQDQDVRGPATPDSQRTPGYPLFVAAVYLVFGFTDTPVLWAHALLFVGLCVGVYLLGRRIGGEPLGILAGFATALYAPIVKYGGMVWSETLTTFLQLFAILTLAVGVERASPRAHFAAGLIFGLLALTRPAFLLEAPLLAAVLLAIQWRSGRLAATAKQAGLLLLAWALVLAPWAAFNYARFGKATPTVARTVGKQLWVGYWVGKFPTRVLLELEDVVAGVKSGKYPRERIAELVRPLGGNPELMARFVEEYTWRDHFPGVPRTPEEKVQESMVKERFYLERALQHIRGDLWSYLYTQLSFVSFKFWAGEIPVRLTLIGSLPRALIYTFFLLQVGVALLALLGCWHLRGTPMMAALLVTPLLYLYVVHLPFHVEPRYSIPVKPFLLLLAGWGALQVANGVRALSRRAA